MALVVFDADGTLWEGLILDGPQARVRVRAGIPEVLKELKKRGHQVAVCSRNDRENLSGHLARLGLAPWVDNVYADWGPKSPHFTTMLADQSETLEVLFVDDDTFNNEEVQRVHPRVVCAFPTDPLDLLEHPMVAAAVTAEDRARVQLLRDQQSRQQAQDAFSGDYQAFLTSTALVLTLYPTTSLPEQGPRILDLLNRTNELRTNRQRYATPEDLRGQLFAAALRDRFGDYGLIAAGLAQRIEDWVVLYDLAVSCRTMGRGVGSALLAWLCQEAQVQGARGVRGILLHTDKNSTMQSMFEFQGFRQVSVGGDSSLWERRGEPPAFPPWLHVEILR